MVGWVTVVVAVVVVVVVVIMVLVPDAIVAAVDVASVRWHVMVLVGD